MPYQNKSKETPEFALTFNLSDLIGTQPVSFNGQNGLFIPFDCNPCLFVGQKRVSVDVNAYRKETPDDRGDTHYLLMKLPKGVQMSPEQLRDYKRIIGNMKPFSAIISRSNQQKGGYAPQGGYPQGGYQQGGYAQQAPAPQYPQQQPQGGYAQQPPQYAPQYAPQGGYQQGGYQQGGYRQQAPAPQQQSQQSAQPSQGGQAGYAKPAPAAAQGGYAPRAPQVPPTPAPPVYNGEDMPADL